MRNLFWAAALAAGIAIAAPALAENAPGVTDTEILIGQTSPYSGPASLYSANSKVEIAYFQMINDKGGINGRKIKIISLDDGYNPAKTVELTRKLVEQDKVAFIFSTIGTPTNVAIRKYLNQNKVPNVFVASGGDFWGDYQHYPWSIGLLPSYRVEANIYAKYILAHQPGAKVGLLYQNDDFGKDYLNGLRDGFGAEFDKRVIRQETYQVTDPTVDSQIVSLKGSGADVLVSGTTFKFGAQAIRKVAELGWHPTHFISYVSSSVGGTLKPAGLDKSVGLITAQYTKDPGDPRWKDDPGINEWRAFMTKYLPGVSQTDNNYINGYQYAETLAQVLRQCGNDLSRENIMKQAANLHDLKEGVLLPGIAINSSPTNYHPVRQMQLARFDGASWVLFGDIIAAN
ncbi:MAG TPA: ABC transporter substrate-binding protein [Stellaceae bacterium]|jgi:branched-chain amino acid transport system substrate-binding protein